MVEGTPFAQLKDAQAPWPAAAGAKAGYAMRGYRFDSKRRPVFRYQFQNITVEDDLQPNVKDLDRGFTRTLTLNCDSPVSGLWFRAATGDIQLQPDGSFLSAGMRYTVKGSKPVLRPADGKAELLIPVTFQNGHATFTVEMVW